MSDNYYLKHYSTRKVDAYTYEYDEWKDSLTGGQKYYVDIIFENGKFARVDFGDKNRKNFDNNLREKELDLLNKIQEEIKKIQKDINKDLKPVIKLKETSTEQTELLNLIGGGDENSRAALCSCFYYILKYVLDECGANKITYSKLNVPSIKINVPLEYEVEIFNPDLLKEKENTVGQGPV